LHKGSHLDPELLPAEKVFRLSTIEAAQALGLDDKIGSLEIGKAADLVLIRLDQPHLVPLYNIFSHLVYAVGREDVSTVIVNGEIIVNQRTFEKLDVHMLMEEVRQIANRIKDE
jgi:5-methylthioadenosine/S-adenosylhomocysteine deaminase